MSELREAEDDEESDLILPPRFRTPLAFSASEEEAGVNTPRYTPRPP